MEPNLRQGTQRMPNSIGKNATIGHNSFNHISHRIKIMTTREILSNMKMIIKVMYKDYERMEHKGTEEYSRIELLEDLEELIKELKNLNVKA